MFELCKSEFLRLRNGAFIALAGLLAIYYMLPRLGFWEILHRNMGFLLLVGGIVLSLAFGIFHALLWRKKNFWVFLIHRPLAPKHIYLSLLCAGVAVILLTVFASVALTTIGYDAFTDRVVDARHYAFAVYLTLVCVACYMVGTLSVLHRSKFAILVFYTLWIVFYPEPYHWLGQYIPVLLALGILFYLNLQCFKPDLERPMKSPFATMILAAAMSYGLVVVLTMGTALFYHLPLTILGQHPDSNPQKGSMKYMWTDNFENGIGYLLENSKHPQAQHYARQATLSQHRNLPIQGWQPPRQNQLHRFDYDDALHDPKSGDVWKFSHDQMLLLGIDAGTKQSIGAIGMNGFISDLSLASESDRFSSVPHLSGNKFLATETALYALDFDTHSLQLKHVPDEGERYTSSLWTWQDSAIISTNKKLLIFDLSTLSNEFSELEVDYQITYPESTKNADLGMGIPVADGYLLMFYGYNYFGFYRQGAEVFITRLDGSFERLGEREFSVFDHPSWIRHYDFMVAPFAHISEELLMHSVDPFDPHFLGIKQIKAQRFPIEVFVIATVLQLLSLIAMWFLTRRHKMANNLRWTWLGVCALMGLPALLSYLLVQPLRDATQQPV